MTPMIRLSCVTFITTLGVVCGFAQEPCQLRVGALNIEWLGRPHNRSGPAKEIAQDPKDIAAYIRASGVAILALEEIEDDDGVLETHTNKSLDATFTELNASGQARWKYRLFAKNQASEHPTWQLTGLAWNECVVCPVNTPTCELEHRLKMDVPTEVTVGAPGKPPMERWATAMKFSAGVGKTDVVVIPIHFKSNRPAFQGQDTEAQREVEAKMLIAGLNEVKSKFADDDIVVIGDSNFLKKGEKAGAAFSAAGFLDLNVNDEITYVTDIYKNPFDRAFVPIANNNPKMKEFLNSKFDVFNHPTFSAEEFRKRISDHRMIRITVDVLTDDD